MVISIHDPKVSKITMRIKNNYLMDFNFTIYILWLSVIGLNATSVLNAQELESNFESPTFSCVNTSVLIANTSQQAQTYEWDFCEGDLVNEIQGIDLGPVLNLREMQDIDLIQVLNNWYGFIVSRGNNKIIRANFGNSLDNTPIFTDLDNP